MPDNLIINARHHLPWHQRLLSNASTAAAWAGWLYLWRPIVNGANWLTSWGASYHQLLAKTLATGTSGSLENSVVALLGTSGTLLLWSRLPARKPTTTPHHQETLASYARHFGMDEQQILAGRAASVCVVHHDAHGKIIGIEPRA
ncbi:poly-beta-1,6-N-acetyl-D-glucosamine biosynthesis protein PgaD [Pseudogulbenkiania sp. MAI-1]|uniref:poly-beta-1,6-N-acetyl-D-glucosamine biosynthesis protein PgaD n=1 Tax=Pseudogulbenkiania sp. MAI-1 TaxID=990370 RepID=UPI00045EA5BB|nr:poly-beta-1,6-N-acetyl-D-glucosamine biosynthesis protein PgaD [Pseudogulbenkiania sp. MAI-1]